MNESMRVFRTLGALVVASPLFGCGGSISPLTVSGAAQSGALPVSRDAQNARRVTAHHSGYFVVILKNLSPGGQSYANGITDHGWVSGFSNLSSAITHATVWKDRRQPTDLRTLGGPDSSIGWDNKSDRGLFAGQSDTANPDPNAEDFCTNGTGDICLGFIWNGSLTALPTLGGNNGQATSVNNSGTVVGFAETTTQDASCAPPQLYDWDAFAWDKTHGIQELAPPSGDVVGAALMVNDRGDSVGASGPTCGPASNALALHAVLWHKGKPVSLATLGGAENNLALSINDEGQIAGTSDLPGDTTSHAVLWSNHGKLTDVGTLSGDSSAIFTGINNRGEAVGQSCASPSVSCRATLYDDGTLYDLNGLASLGGYYFVNSADVNDEGAITGEAVNVSSGQTVVFVATPNEHAVTRTARVEPPALPEHIWQQLQFRSLHHFGRPF